MELQKIIARVNTSLKPSVLLAALDIQFYGYMSFVIKPQIKAP